MLSPSALATLAPTARGVPASLWQRVLTGPVTELLARPGKGFRAQLTEIAYRLGGGQGVAPPALAAMLELVHAGSMIIDDIEDDSLVRRGGPAVHRLHGMPLALNAGNWLYFAPFDVLPELGLDADRELHLHRRISRVLLDCHFGQALDLGAQLGTLAQASIPDVVATITALKTGRLLALAAEAGAITAGASQTRAWAIADFGQDLGVGLQMLDDLDNLSGRLPPGKRFEDLRAGRVTWPWAWAAAELDDGAFAALVAERDRLAREAADSDDARGCARWQPLAARLRATVGAHGRLTCRWHLRQARLRLRAAVGEHAALAALEREIARLEASYG
jgi:geranylgeranyl pyrophosphate synthase